VTWDAEDVTTPTHHPMQKRILVRGVRASSGGRVQLWSLRDGWAVFPDWDAAHRRWVAVGLIGAALLFVAGPALYKFFGGVGIGVGGIGVVVMVAYRIGDTRALRRAKREKQQLRFDAIHRAGGLDSIQWAAQTGGRNAQTVGEANILLTALGFTSPVISANSVTSATAWRTRFGAAVEVKLVDGDGLTYRVRGRRTPDKLIELVSRPLGAKCTIA